MTKLVNSMRNAVVKRLVERTRAPRDAKFRNREHALAVRMLRARYGDDVFERCRALPDGWLRVHKHLRFPSDVSRRLTPCRVEYCYDRRAALPMRVIRSLGQVELDEYAPLPASVADTWEVEQLAPHLDDIESLCRDRRAHEDELAMVETQARALLAAYTTVELLSKEWPEGYALLPAEMLMPPPTGVPAPRIADLNARIEALREAA